MKKALLLALTLAIATPSAHAADIKKIAFSSLKCVWHVTKIGGGVLCLGTSTIPLATSVLAHMAPKIPELTNSPADNQIIHDYLVEVAKEINQINRKTTITDEQIALAENWYANNQATAQDFAKSLNGLKSWIRNRAALFVIGYWAAGSTCIWSGAKGLYQELTGSEKTESDEQYNERSFE